MGAGSGGIHPALFWVEVEIQDLIHIGVRVSCLIGFKHVLIKNASHKLSHLAKSSGLISCNLHPATYKAYPKWRAKIVLQNLP